MKWVKIISINTMSPKEYTSLTKNRYGSLREEVGMHSPFLLGRLFFLDKVWNEGAPVRAPGS